MNSLLRGAPGTRVELTLLEGDNQVSRTVTRYTPEALNEKSFSHRYLSDLCNLFYGSINYDESYVRLGKVRHDEGDNFAAAPYFISAIKCPVFNVPMFDDDRNAALPESINFFACTGMYAQLDDAVQKCLTISNKPASQLTDADGRLLALCVEVLTRHGFFESARIIDDRLYKQQSTFSAETKMRVLVGLASVMRQPMQTISGWLYFVESLVSYQRKLWRIC